MVDPLLLILAVIFLLLFTSGPSAPASEPVIVVVSRPEAEQGSGCGLWLLIIIALLIVFLTTGQ